MVKIELTQLYNASVHLGHKIHEWNPKMLPYIYTETKGSHVLDLVQIKSCLESACNFSKNASRNKKTFLFLNTSKKTAPFIASQAKKCGAFFVNYRWLGGILTNWVTVKKRIDRLNELEEEEKLTSFKDFSKKERSILKKELEKLKKYFTGIKKMTKLPDILILVNQKREIIAIKEALSLKIPIITILDTDCNPDLTTLPIPGNDDSTLSVHYIIQKLTDSICLGQLNSKEI
uniref:Small ribosomal subunit protein uS2c n=1 Tax=Phaeophyceae sp. TaxID=2249243 RepID=A0A8E5FAP8_9PHAE|nr:ribosomal protein S2 [Phaeophyceae sp.]